MKYLFVGGPLDGRRIDVEKSGLPMRAHAPCAGLNASEAVYTMRRFWSCDDGNNGKESEIYFLHDADPKENVQKLIDGYRDPEADEKFKAEVHDLMLRVMNTPLSGFLDKEDFYAMLRKTAPAQNDRLPRQR